MGWLRWWTPAGLEAAEDEDFAPADLPALVRALVEDGPPGRPTEVGAQRAIHQPLRRLVFSEVRCGNPQNITHLRDVTNVTGLLRCPPRGHIKVPLVRWEASRPPVSRR